MTTKYSYELNTEKIEKLCKELLQCTNEGDFLGASLCLAGIQVELGYLNSKLHAHKNEGYITAHRIRNPEDQS